MGLGIAVHEQDLAPEQGQAGSHINGGNGLPAPPFAVGKNYPPLSHEVVNLSRASWASALGGPLNRLL